MLDERRDLLTIDQKESDSITVWSFKLGPIVQRGLLCLLSWLGPPLVSSPIFYVPYRTATSIPVIYSFSGNSAASAPISTFMCLWAIYIFLGSVYIFPPAEQADPSWEYIIRSQTHECGNWDWGPDIPFLGIFVSNFRHFVFAVHTAIKPTL